jgi:hypothetical protein
MNKAIHYSKNILYALLIIFAIAGYVKIKQISKKNVEKILEKRADVVVPEKKDPVTEILENSDGVKCEFAQKLPKGNLTGTIYANKNQARLDITAPDNFGVVKTSHTIVDSKAMLLWFDSNKSGMKVLKVTNRETTQESSSADTEETSPIQSIANSLTSLTMDDSKCTEWEPDQFMFIAPPEITFIDAKELTQSVNNTLCQKCELEDDEASRLLCRRELKCNQ